LALTSGCGPKTLTVDELRLGPLSYLQEGKTTREEVLLKLGVPSADFEAGRILTYRIAQNAQGGITARPRQGGVSLQHPRPLENDVPQDALLADYSLVLVFDDKGLLKKQSLLPIK
jgi:hypothetical protein